MPEYEVSSIAVSEAYDNLADMEAETAKHANQQSDNYVLLTVLFAIVLFFAGVSAKFKNIG